MRPTLDTAKGSGGRPRVSSERRRSVRLLPGLCAAIALEPTLPEIFFFAHVLGDPAAEDGEGVAQAVDVAQRPLAQRLHSRELDDPTLGPAAHGTRLVQKGVDAAASGERERAEWLEVLLAVIHQALERGHLGLTDPEHALVH